MKIFSKVLLLLVFTISFSWGFSQTNYDALWQKVAENSKDGTYKSNLPIILDIQAKAMKENNALQIIRSLKGEFSMINQTQDDEKNDAASQFFKKIQNAEKSLKGNDLLIFKVLASNFVLDYYHQNAWEINRRTLNDSQDLSQIETWSKLDFKNYIHKSDLNVELLKQNFKDVPLAKYKSLFTAAQNINYFSTLSDWYLFQKINYLSDSELFTKNELAENQTAINTLLDDLINSNSGNARLYFKHQKIIKNCEFNSCKDKIEQLQNLMNAAEDGDYKVLIAEDLMANLSANKKAGEALELGKQIKLKYPKSPFLVNIKSKENEILVSTLILNYELQTQANLPIHIVANYKNVNQFSLKIYEVKSDLLSFIKFKDNLYNDNFKNIEKSLVREDQFQLTSPKDYQNHQSSLEIKALPSGIYLAEYLMNDMDSEEEYEPKKFYFIVSNHKIIDQAKAQKDKPDNEKKLVNAENGKSINNENIVFYEFSDRQNLIRTEAKTDKDGVFILPKSSSDIYYRNILVHQPKTNDYQWLTSYGNDRFVEYGNNDKSKSTSQIFTDRAIYRPGQTVYFKVINTKIENGVEAVVPNYKQKIILKDANDQEVGNQEFTTNEFGSYHGSFILPKGKLNGRFMINAVGTSNGIKWIDVEEYKRPKFEVTFDAIKDEYKFGEKIELKGKAMMFSGVALSNTTVKYEIKKNDIRWRYFSWYGGSNDNENSILGEVTTNEKGEFTIPLDLKKDDQLEGIQINNYEINASITDSNGETQFGDTQLKIASVSHYIKADEVKNAMTDENVIVKVSTKNYNEQNLKKSYQVKLSKLETPNRIFRQNFESEVQNLPQFSKEEFITKFPYDLFDKNDKLTNWKVEKTLVNKIQQPSSDNNQLTTNLDLGTLEAGDYSLELYNIEGKDTIKTIHNFSVWDKKSLKPNQKTFLTVLQPKNEFERGEKATIYAYSAIPNALLHIFVQDGSGKTAYETQSFKNGVLAYEVNISQDKKVTDLNIQFQVVAYNDIQTETVYLKIKNTDKPLKIETVTFRDKLQPNSKEKWTVKVTGNEKEKINAEVLANMYDMSLDQFATNNFSFINLFQNTSYITSYQIRQNLEQKSFQKRYPYFENKEINVPQFNWFDGDIGILYSQDLDNDGILDYLDSCPTIPGLKEYSGCPKPKEMTAMEVQYSPSMKLSSTRLSDDTVDIVNSGRQLTEAEKVQYTDVDADGVLDKDDGEHQMEKIKVRKNLNETAFFYPDLKTDAEGNVNFEFTSPEALTKWKLMFLAHTKNAKSATLEKEVVTQKEFSVTPNYPRFLREGDELNLQSKLSNLTDKKLSGSAQLQILDAFTNNDITSQFGLNANSQNFNLNENGNTALTWKVKVPNNVSSIILKVVAKAGAYSDGEQKAIPILPNRMLVTDALPIFVKEGETKTFVLENLQNANYSTISNVSNTLELTTNPIWEILFSLPSLKNDQDNSADVIFNKWFADVLASEIFKSNPKLKTVFEEYQNKGLLPSNLEKNQELKQLLLEETPWVLDSKNEEEQMAKLALLFDANTMKNSINQDWDDFKKLQNADGGFSWYSGYPSSYGTSLSILKNLGKINVWLKGNTKEFQYSERKELVSKLIKYIDAEITNYYHGDQPKNAINNWTLDYLDTRNYWEKEFPLKGKGLTLKNAVKEKVATTKLKDFTFFGLHRMALLTNNYGLKDLSNKLLNYLKETSTDTKTQGVYWKQNLNDWGWFGSNVVNHAGALEAFNILKPTDEKFIEEMKIWLITQKEVNSWGSSRSTAEVIFTILNSGKSWTTPESDKTNITWGGKVVNPQTEATGYLKSAVKTDVIDKNLASVTVSKQGAGIVQGGLFWQYYEDLNKIRSAENYISISKELYKKVKTTNGEELQKISAETPVRVGDKVTVRMLLNTDRAMEFVHLKDMRAAGFEPLDVISGYQWKNNLGYYQSTKDASTNFYIQYMPKGKYVFEYDFVANASGTFSNGITTLQNYYVPQMNAHTKGTTVQIME
ncbi:alpha-2-macroglobulin family protein [Chryseobacterium sp.]|uniref:alpha-2-macroglobulin family protein n=1 Tax=Chryseobacterium sp. TaxID=1871047 RepID=UPI00388D240D